MGFVPLACARFLAAGIAALALAACSGGGGDSAAASSSLGAERTLFVQSAYTGQTYGVTVYTPPGYTTSADAKPIIYALDRELQYQQVQNAVFAFQLDAIIVAVSHISGDRRFVDFELPGAEAYFRFLTLEVIPLVEAQYRVDRSRRTLMGYSLSGLMATLAILLEQPSSRYFSGAVVTDASFQFHTQETLALEQRMFDTSRDLPMAVHMCYTISRAPYSEMPERIASRGYLGLRMSQRYYPASHAAVLVPCVEDGLRFVFGRS
jgi:putative esterase